MKYVYTNNISPVVGFISQAITSRLGRGESVLWIISGGSAILTEAAVASHLAGLDLTNLSVTLADERFGPMGHPNENWQQLLDAGFMLPGASLYRPLIGANRTIATTAFDAWLGEHLRSADYSIGLFGIGADGHTAGIKPATDAVTVTTGWATDFDGDDFERITMTFQAIMRLNEVVIQAMGADKADTLEQLITQDISPLIQPAQVLKSVSQCTLFTDYKEV